MKRTKKVTAPSYEERYNASLAQAAAAITVIEEAILDLYQAALEQDDLASEAFARSENYDNEGKALLTESANNNDAAKRLSALLNTITN